MDLITIKCKEFQDEYHNELTSEIDKYVLDNCKITIEYGGGTYLSGRPTDEGMGIRFPGATRGELMFDSEGIITSIEMYDDEVIRRVQCYKPEVHEIIKKYVGAKLIFEEE